MKQLNSQQVKGFVLAWLPLVPDTSPDVSIDFIFQGLATSVGET